MSRETTEQEDRVARAAGEQPGLDHTGPVAMGRRWVAVHARDSSII